MIHKIHFPEGGGAPVKSAQALCLLELTDPFSLGSGRVCLIEPADTPIERLRRSLADGSYAKPFILEDGAVRSLLFDRIYVQSSMHLSDPVRLRLRYTRKMMGCLLFHPEPKQITLIGLGGGSLAKYCHQHLPASDITAVEIDPHVVALREHFLVPPDSDRFRVITDDGMHHLAVDSTQIDVLLVDAYVKKGVASSIASDAFLLHAFRRLAPDGVFVMNLTGDIESYMELISLVKKRFHQRVVTVPVGADANHILFAFKDKHFVPDWPLVKQRAAAMPASTSIDYRFIANAIEQEWSKNHSL